MPNSFAPETVILWLSLALPVALLATLGVILRMRVKARKNRNSQALVTTFDSVPRAQGNSSISSQEVHTTGMHFDRNLHGAARAAGAIETNIKTAETSGNVTVLSGLFLELARARAASGDEKGALVALRSAAGTGAKYGPKSAHAAARLELADAAYRAGDLTSACEQWQLARTAFQEAGQVPDQNHVDKLMRDHGCPTDWVLTDF